MTATREKDCAVCAGVHPSKATETPDDWCDCPIGRREIAELIGKAFSCPRDCQGCANCDPGRLWGEK